MYIIALIPARSGSKRIPNKNIKLYNNKPLIYWSIQVALNSKYINKVVVSTDCKEIACIARSYNASVPFLRPKELSEDLSTDYEFVKHYIDSIEKKPDLIVQLRPTYPNRDVKTVDDCIKQLIENFDSYSCLRTVCENDKPAYKMYKINDLVLTPLFETVDNLLEPYNMPAQILPKTYWHNGYIDIIKTDTVINEKSITGSKIYPYIMNKDEVDDIDTEEDWIKSEKKHKQYLAYQSV